MKKYNQLTSVEKYKRMRRRNIECKSAKWVSILSPYFIIGAVNFNEYFTEYNGVKMSLGCVLACVVAGIAIMNETKGKDSKINGIVGWAVAFALIYLMSSILNDLLLIVGCGFIGQLVGKGFELGGENYEAKAKILYKANVEAEAMNEKA